MMTQKQSKKSQGYAESTEQPKGQNGTLEMRLGYYGLKFECYG